MKTVRLNHTNSSQLLPIINAVNDNTVDSSYFNSNINTSPMNSSKNGSPKGLSKTGSQLDLNSPSTSNNGSPTKIAPNQSPKSASHTQEQSANALAATTNATSGSTGLVRRLSVTARPGDIFYKVKDVTESCSTTDTITIDQNVNNDELNDDEQEQEIIIKSVNSNENEIENQVLETVSPQASSNNISPKSENNNNNSTLGRKTTTWNVRRNQTTNLGLNQQPNSPSNENTFKKIKSLTSKDDTSIELNSVNQNQINSNSINGINNSSSPTTSTVEPGSPNFTKELLSIRYIFKWKNFNTCFFCCCYCWLFILSYRDMT